MFYAGLILAAEFGKKCSVARIDINQSHIDAPKSGRDTIIELNDEKLTEAIGSVPRSIGDNITTNIDGFFILVAVRDSKIKSFTYAASSSAYGDQPSLPKVEVSIGKPLSRYAVI